MGITEIADVLLKLVVVAAILAIGWLFIRRRPPEPEEPEPPTPTEPVVTPLGVDVRCSVYPQEWPHGKFCPDCFPEGSALRFVGLYDDNDPGDPIKPASFKWTCLLYTSDAADDLLCVDLGGRRIIKKKKHITMQSRRHDKTH